MSADTVVGWGFILAGLTIPAAAYVRATWRDRHRTRRIAEDQWVYAEDYDQDEVSVPMPQDQHDPERDIQARVVRLLDDVDKITATAAQPCPACGQRVADHLTNEGVRLRCKHRVVKPADPYDWEAEGL